MRKTVLDLGSTSDYDSEEEEISKIIRSMINFVDEEEDIKTIFKAWGGCKMGIIFLWKEVNILPMKWGYNSPLWSKSLPVKNNCTYDENKYCTHNIYLITNLLISKIIPKLHRLWF